MTSFHSSGNSPLTEKASLHSPEVSPSEVRIEAPPSLEKKPNFHPYSVTIGLEEEVFAIEAGRDRPTLQSLDYLRKVWQKSPIDGIARTASNFAKKEDRKTCFMGSIEISTCKASTPNELISDLVHRRKVLAEAAKSALIVPIGALPNCPSPSNTASSHIHIGVPSAERLRVYHNLAYFIPLFGIASACSPIANNPHSILSYRLTHANLLGPLSDDYEFRFQDMIISKRLGTIEIRLFDPIPELNRLTAILKGLIDVSAWNGTIPFNREEYNALRPKWATNGMIPELNGRLEKLQEISNFDRQWIEESLGHKLDRSPNSQSICEELDRIWREPTGIIAQPQPIKTIRVIKGLTGYYALKLPFMAVKGYREWYGTPK